MSFITFIIASAIIAAIIAAIITLTTNSKQKNK